MQLPLGDDPRTEMLRQLQPRLIQRFGRIERAPRERRAPEWVLVQGVIGARTRSETSNAATDRLLAEYGSWEAVGDAPLEALQAHAPEQVAFEAAALAGRGEMRFASLVCTGIVALLLI